ncbi:GTP pyrophosphokinase [Microbacterium sp. 22296]|uniref:GTP pyrophosphokinase n=1 Tax=Microbacterium sp. 22296 TaxID=3453903 RepID=UPI003F82B761
MGPKIVGLIQDLLGTTNVGVLDISHRVKTRESATKKIDASGGRFETFQDLHDMLGVRVVTYLQSDVDMVVKILSENLDVDAGRSSNKASMLDPDRFGYLSHHLVVKLNGARATLGEYKPYADMYFEVQIRSILQHAWAQIEHDLGYKSPSGIPSGLKRRFARLAGLLETADYEFDALRDETTRHASLVKMAIESGDDAAVDQDSIEALVASNGATSRADRAIAAGIGATIENNISSEYASRRAAELQQVGLGAISEVEEALEAQFDGLVQFAIAWLGDPGTRPSIDEFYEADEVPDNLDRDGRYLTLSPGVSLFYLYLHRQMQGDDPQSELVHVAHMDNPAFFGRFQELHRNFFG